MRHGLMRTALIGLLIGFVSGVLTFVTIFVWLVIHAELFDQGRGVGPSFVWGPLVIGIPATSFSVVLGAIAGAFAGLKGIRLDSLRGGFLFGATLMGLIGTSWAFVIYSGNPARFDARFYLSIGVLCPILAGMAGGAFVGRICKTL